MLGKKQLSMLIGTLMLLFMVFGAGANSAEASGYDYNVGYELYTHYVQPGETLSEIAQWWGTSVQEILNFNGHIWNAHYIHAGAVLTIPVPVASNTGYTGGEYHPPAPPSTGYTGDEYHPAGPSTGYTGGEYHPACRAYHHVQAGETLSSIAWWYGMSVYSIAQANHIYNHNWIYAGDVLCIP